MYRIGTSFGSNTDNFLNAETLNDMEKFCQNAVKNTYKISIRDELFNPVGLLELCVLFGKGKHIKYLRDNYLNFEESITNNSFGLFKIAILRQDISMIRYLLSLYNMEKYSAFKPSDTKIFDLAVKNSSIPVIELLFSREAFGMESLLVCLDVAISNNNAVVLNYLLSLPETKVHLKNNAIRLLLNAVDSNSGEVFKILLNQWQIKIQLHGKTKDLTRHAINKKSISILNAIEEGNEIEFKACLRIMLNTNASYYLDMAVSNNDPRLLEFLLKHGRQELHNSFKKGGLKLLMTAIDNDLSDIFDVLVKQKHIFTQFQNEFQDYIAYIIENNKTRIMSTLLQYTLFNETLSKNILYYCEKAVISNPETMLGLILEDKLIKKNLSTLLQDIIRVVLSHDNEEYLDKLNKASQIQKYFLENMEDCLSFSAAKNKIISIQYLLNNYVNKYMLSCGVCNLLIDIAQNNNCNLFKIMLTNEDICSSFLYHANDLFIAICKLGNMDIFLYLFQNYYHECIADRSNSHLTEAAKSY